MAPLKELLQAYSQAGWLYTETESSAVRCFACGHNCLIQPDQRGICQMRTNDGGILMVPWGYVAALNVDPIEKKPLMHFLPGSGALTFGMLGCNFHCDFCQNWISSQAMRDPDAASAVNYIQEIELQELVAYAQRSGAASIVSSYNEPLITSEWAIAIFTLAREHGLRTAYVSNGFASPEVMTALQPVLDAFKIDLKCMTDEKYRDLGGRLEVVKDSIRRGKELGFWVEVVTLVIPGFNDSEAELHDMADFLAGVSVDIPWHVTAYYPTYKRQRGSRTGADALQRAASIGQDAGLRYVYAGNLPGRVGPLENTYCPRCEKLLVARSGYSILENHITMDGTCPQCGEAIAGIWH